MNKSLKLLFLIITFSALLGGAALRVASFGWNDRLQGDVNLFALTAREFVLNGDLYYPMKYEYSEFTEYRVLRSPASQHPPLWPYVAGLLGRLLSTEDTFSVLKMMSEVVGILLIVGVAYFGIHGGRIDEILISISGIALSPLLVDFSANGSSYILSALMIVLAVILLRVFDHQKLAHYVLSGVLCGIGLQVHSAMVFLPLVFFVFWLWERSQVKWYGVIAFVLTGLLTITPWMVWNWLHFGKPFYSYSTYHLLGKLGLAHTGLYNGVITTRITGSVNEKVLRLYVSLVGKNAVVFLMRYLLEVGPFCLVLATIGCIRLFKHKRRDAVAFILPYLFYVIIILLWGTSRHRFLVPALPAAYIAASVGFVGLYHYSYSKHPMLKLLGIICLIGTLAWGVPSFLEKPPTRYTLNDDRYALQYDKMLPLARELKNLEPGVVLGYTGLLDGGIETVYWHKLPYVCGRGLEMHEIQKLVHDFGIRYVWTDQVTKHQIESSFPKAALILSNDLYCVFEISE
jgi:hypothetical protein